MELQIFMQCLIFCLCAADIMAPGHIFDGRFSDGHIFDGHFSDRTYSRQDIFSTTK